MDAVVEEYESFFRTKVGKTIFNSLIQYTYRRDNICYFDNIRICYAWYNNILRKVCQIKKVHKLTRTLRIIQLDETVKIVPICRSHSSEELAIIPSYLYSTTGFTVRHVLYEKNNIRISADEVISSQGTSFFFCGEHEYTKNDAMKWKNYKMRENELFDVLLDKFKSIFLKINFNLNFDTPKIEDIYSIPSRKFSNFHDKEFDSSSYLILPKWDGYKGRFVIKESGVIFTLNDVGEICVVYQRFEFDNIFGEKIWIQYEILESVQKIVITDILGVYINKKLYMPDAEDVILYFKSLNLKGFTINFRGNLDVNNYYAVQIQKPVPSLDARFFPIDGFILVSNNKLFKYKIPTIDFRVCNNLLYIDGEITPECFDDYNLKDGCIYEFQKKGNTFSCIKLRHDRKYTSTVEEYKEFQANCNLLSSASASILKK